MLNGRANRDVMSIGLPTTGASSALPSLAWHPPSASRHRQGRSQALGLDEMTITVDSTEVFKQCVKAAGQAAGMTGRGLVVADSTRCPALRAAARVRKD
jgi:hypothetical protein